MIEATDGGGTPLTGTAFVSVKIGGQIYYDLIFTDNRCNILTSTTFHYPILANENACLIPVYPLSSTVFAK